MRYYVLLLCLFLLPTVARAETYTVWEDVGIIYGRAESTGVTVRVSEADSGAHNPYVDHHMVVWEDSRGFSVSIYSHQFDRDIRNLPLRMTTAGPCSDPIVSWGGASVFDYWAAWREQGGVWANYADVRTRNNHAAFEVVGDYTGPFSLDGNVLSYDGGQVAMDPPPPPIPEPSTLALLLVGLLCVLLPSRNRVPLPGQSEL